MSRHHQWSGVIPGIVCKECNTWLQPFCKRYFVHVKEELVEMIMEVTAHGNPRLDTACAEGEASGIKLR